MSEQPASRETELKFELTLQALGALQQHKAFLGKADSSRLRSTYFDTPDHDLRTAGVSLRVRTQNGGFVQTVKRRKCASGVDRDEWESKVAGEAPEPAAYADTPVASILEDDGAHLRPVFATEIDRAVRLWRLGDSVVEMSVDQGEVNAGGVREPIRELELELKAGQPSALFVLARELATATPVRLSFATKADRGYRLAGHDEAFFKAESVDLTEGLNAGEVFRRIAWNCLMHAEGNASLLRRVRSPEALHQARVGLRRLRAAASAFKPMLTDPESAAVKAEAKWLAGELDEARDLDVFIARAFPVEDEEGDHLPDDEARAVASLRGRLLDAQAKAYDRAVAAIESDRFAKLLLDAAAWLSVGAWTTTDDPLARAAREEPGRAFGARALDRLMHKVIKGGKGLAHLDTAARHALRIRVKKLRYGAEFFLPIAGDGPAKRRRRFVEALKALQENLGALNDIAVARQTVLNAIGRRSPEMALTAGELIARRTADEGALLKAAVRDYAKLKRAEQPWRAED